MMGSEETLLAIKALLAAPTAPTGSATSAKQDTGNTSLASIDTKTPALSGGKVPVVDSAGATEATLALLKSGLDFGSVTKSDSTVLTGVRAIYIGTGGDLVVDGAVATNITFKAVPSGTLLPIAVVKVRAATAASDIVAIY